MQRIESFLEESEVPEWASSFMATPVVLNTETGFSNATFEWPSMPKAEPSIACFELGPLNITFPKGKLTLVSGPTGSGKSALLLSMLGGKQRKSRYICQFIRI